jgi:hypothetical protein
MCSKTAMAALARDRNSSCKKIVRFRGAKSNRASELCKMATFGPRRDCCHFKTARNRDSLSFNSYYFIAILVTHCSFHLLIKRAPSDFYLPRCPVSNTCCLLRSGRFHISKEPPSSYPQISRNNQLQMRHQQECQPPINQYLP